MIPRHSASSGLPYLLLPPPHHPRHHLHHLLHPPNKERYTYMSTMPEAEGRVKAIEMEVYIKIYDESNQPADGSTLLWSAPVLVIDKADEFYEDGRGTWGLLHDISQPHSSRIKQPFPVFIRKARQSMQASTLFVPWTSINLLDCSQGGKKRIKIEPLPYYLMSPIKVLLLTPCSNSFSSARLPLPPESVLHEALIGQPLPSYTLSLTYPGLDGQGVSYVAHIYDLWPFDDDDDDEGTDSSFPTPPLANVLRQWGGIVTSATKVMVQGQTCDWQVPTHTITTRGYVSSRISEPNADLLADLCLRLRSTLRQAGDAGNASRPLMKSRRSLIVEGPAGSGKTSLVYTAARSVGLCIVEVRPGRLMAGHDVEADHALEMAMNAAKALTPAILMIDNVDLLVSTREKMEASKGEVDRALERWIRRLEEGEGVENGVMVVLTAREGWKGWKGHPANKLLVTPPDLSKRADFLGALLHWNGPAPEQKELLRIAYRCQGFTLGELIALSRRANMLKEGVENSMITWPRALDEALAEGRKLRLSGGSRIPITKIHPPVAWSDVGGLRAAKEAVKEMVTLPMTYPQAFARLGIRPPTGLLLYGPPGTGKTLLARAAACQTGAGFLSIRISDIVRGKIGTSEIKLRDAFRTALRSRPVLVFIDEFQALFTSRDHGSGSSGGRLASQLLQSMDELTTRTEADHAGGHVVVLAATNSPEAIDPAFLRPGRFDRLIYAALPDLEDRMEILEGLKTRMRWSPEIDLRTIAEKTDGFSGADLSNLFRHAALHALSSSLSSNQKDLPLIGPISLDKALKVCKPTTSMSTLTKFEKFRKQHCDYSSSC